MDNEDNSKSSGEYSSGEYSSEESSEFLVVQKPCVKIRAQEISRLLACPLCKELCKDAVTINRCNHSFCQKCINQKIQGVGGLKSCPYCNEDLSSYSPDQYLRPDKALRSMIDKMFGNEMGEPYQLITRTSESENQIDENKTGAILKKKSIRKPRQFPSTQENNKNTTENEEETSTFSFWFQLSPQEGKKEHSYPKLARSYIHVKNANLSLSVSVIHWYLMEKLNLANEDEVEICCFGEPLIKDLTLRDIYEIWVKCILKAPPSHSCNIISQDLNAKKLVMELTYRKNLKDDAQPTTPTI